MIKTIQDKLQNKHFLLFVANKCVDDIVAKLGKGIGKGTKCVIMSASVLNSAVTCLVTSRILSPLIRITETQGC